MPRYHTLIPFFIEGAYDDYGRIEDATGVMAPILLDMIRPKLIAQEADKFGRYLIIPETINWLGIQDAMTDGLTTVDKQKLDMIMIRSDVMNEILEHYTFKLYINGTTQASYARLMKEFDEIYASMNGTIADEEELADLLENTDKEVYDKILSIKQSITEYAMFRNSNNCLAVLLDNDMYIRNSILNAKELLISCVKANQPKEHVYRVASNIVKMIVLNSFVNSTHRQWVIPGYAGQEGNTEPHQLLASTVIKITEKMHQEQEEW